ncbi:MAG: proline--tRNA ligase [Candidatus Nanoarchaeia archaeon]|jgi:prolyl-tRNA synthetase
MGEEQGLKANKSNFQEWYAEVLNKADMIDYSQVKGFHILKPWSYFIWEQVMEWFNKELKKYGVDNAYFPLVMPKSLIEKEKEHVEGFAPEILTCTKAGDDDLEEELYIRPTSEMIIYDSFTKWIRSWRDLPLKINQWCNIIRWEKQTNPFLRPREFLWQEGHCAFATQEEALADQMYALKLYEKIYKELFAIPMILGEKTPAERFAGADKSFSPETVLPDGRTIQAGTSHYLGQNFSKALGITFLNEKGKSEYAYQTSWGISIRSIGVMILAHGDDKGLVLPPRLAKYQVVIVPIYKDDTKELVLKEARKLAKSIKARVFIDESNKSPGWKFNHWELKGVPLRIELGPRDIEKKQVVVAKRTGGKSFIKVKDLDVKALLEEFHNELFDNAVKVLKSKVKKVETKTELYKTIKDGFVAKACWCGDPEHEIKLKNDLGAKSANMPFNEQLFSKTCAFCKDKAKYVVLYSKQY